MLTFAFVSGLMIAFVTGAVAGCNATAADRRETAELRAALNAKQSELEQNKQRYEERLEAAYEAIAEYDDIFDQLEQARFPAKTAVVIPFKNRIQEQ